MALTFLLDENVPRSVWRAIERHNEDEQDPLDVLCVGEPTDLPLSSSDRDILIWAEARGRILVTEDRSTMPAHLKAHLDSGHHCPGILMLHAGGRVSELIEFLVLVAYASKPAEWEDHITFVHLDS